MNSPKFHDPFHLPISPAVHRELLLNNNQATYRRKKLSLVVNGEDIEYCILEED